jgi:hypothetical protein
MNSCRIRVHIAAIALLYVPPTWAQQFRPSGSPQAQPPAPSTAPIPIVCDWKAYSRDDLIEQASRLRESALSVIAVEPPLQGCIGSAALVLGYASETADLRSLTAYIEREVRVIESSRMTFRSGTVASVITAIGRRARLAVQVGKASSMRETPEFEYLLSLLSPVWIVRNTTPVREDLPTRLDVVAIQTERILFQLTSGERNREERKILIARFETGTPNRAAARLFRAHLTSKSADPTRPNKDPVGPWREQ